MAERNGGRQEDVTVLEFTVSDEEYPFVGASASADCEVVLSKMLPRDEGRFSEFYAVHDAAPTALRRHAENVAEIEVSVHRTEADQGLVEFVVGDSCPTVRLAKLHALPRVVRGDCGVGRVVVDVPGDRNPSPIVNGFLDDHPGFRLVAKRTRSSIPPQFGGASFRHLVERHLTERQREVLLSAYEAGYYDWPRETTGAAVAADLGITSATFSEHIHAAERKLLSVLFDHGLDHGGGQDTAGRN